MYKLIMIPVDLEHADTLEKALEVGSVLAKHYEAELYIVGVTHAAPGAVAHNPLEYAEKLQAFAADQTAKHGIDFKSKAVVSHDPAVDLDDKLMQVASDIRADLIVMASHIPGFLDYVFASKAGYLASHSNLSVFIVR
ncbi:MAG: universal stress protein [Pseudomonadota bacterium]